MAVPRDPQPAHVKRPGQRKRLIACCDGTWMDSLGPKGNEPPSNVTRISRAFRRTCSDGTHQVISYFAGVGTDNILDRFTGGAFGLGLDRGICEVYNFICTNYVEGDDIILIGYSRGAFTARSVADMIAAIGLLTLEGLDHFYAIFDDYENMGKTDRDLKKYLVPGLLKYNGEQGRDKVEWEAARMRQYRLGLKQLGFTRDTYHDNMTDIKVKAVAVWDTVGALGIPPAPVIGIRGSADQWVFTNTNISNKVENAFQALALDEPRHAFRPSLWERLPGSTTNLKQVWFPGSHGNVGGGWYDQQLADIALAWMCDQLSTLGMEFNIRRLTAQFHQTLCYSAAHPFPYCPAASKGLSLSSFVKLPLSSIKRSVTKLRWRSSTNSSSKGNSNGITRESSRTKRASTISKSSVRSTTITTSEITTPTTTTASINGKNRKSTDTPLPWANPTIYRPPLSGKGSKEAGNKKSTTISRDTQECTLHNTGGGRPITCFSPHPDATTPAAELLRRGARPWGLGTMRVPPTPPGPSMMTMSPTPAAVRRPGRALRVDETTNEITSHPLLATSERIHASVRVRLACGGLGPDDAGPWSCHSLLRPLVVGDDGGPYPSPTSSSSSVEANGGGGGGGGRWKLERGLGLSEVEEREVREALKKGPRELRLPSSDTVGAYPAGGLYPVGENDHHWRWVWEGKVEGEGNERVPQTLVLPEEPLVGYWERYLLGLTAGDPDVWKYSQRGIQL
ncbi:hypothetical protein VTH82DRAFT_447 [Thermothelomyces myriococcoides]